MDNRILNQGMINSQSKKNRLPLIIGIGIICLLAVIAIVMVTIKLNSNTEDEYTFAKIREDTKTLQLYAKLEEEMTAGDLERVVREVDQDAEISFFDNGTGQIKLPGQSDYILFDHDLAIESNYISETAYEESDEYEVIEEEIIDEEYDETSDEEDDKLDDEEHLNEDGSAEEIELPTVAYQPSDIVKEIRYASPYVDGAFVIRYISEENSYEVSDLMEVYTFPTKQEAIESYLAPIVTPSGS